MNKDQVIKSNWFDKFHIGNDLPGARHSRDEGELRVWESNKIEARKLGWSENNVTYNINSNGYRGAIEPGVGVSAAFGCSFTFGSSVDEHQPWPYILDIANCGQPGSSNDKIARLAISYINTFKPTDIYVCWTFPQRREWVDEKGNVIAFKNVTPVEAAQILSQTWVSWDNALLHLSNDLWDEYNYTKNVMLLEGVCSMNNITLHQTSVLDMNHTQYPYGRDLTHPGADWHVIIAEQFLNN